MVLDNRKLNKFINSVHNSDKIVSYYMLPNISDLLATPGNCKIFSSLDLPCGYHHIGIKPEARSKTAFITLSGKMAFKLQTYLYLFSTQNILILMSEVLNDLDFHLA